MEAAHPKTGEVNRRQTWIAQFALFHAASDQQ